jgi:hypothetical protein
MLWPDAVQTISQAPNQALTGEAVPECRFVHAELEGQTPVDEDQRDAFPENFLQLWRRLDVDLVEVKWNLPLNRKKRGLNLVAQVAPLLAVDGHADHGRQTVTRMANPMATTPVPRPSRTHSRWWRFQCARRFRVGRAEAASKIATSGRTNTAL